VPPSETCYVGDRTNTVKGWSSNGELLASGSADRLANNTGYLDFALNVRIATDHTQRILSVKFMPHASDCTILTAAGDARVRLFDAAYTSARLNSAANKSNQLPHAPTPPAEQDSFFGKRLATRRDILPLKQYSYAQNQHKVYKYHTSRVKRIVNEENP